MIKTIFGLGAVLFALVSDLQDIKKMNALAKIIDKCHLVFIISTRV
jgi:hypothetical protein